MLPSNKSFKVILYKLPSLYSAYDLVVPAEGKALVKTDIQIELPEGCYGRVAPRSGLSWKNHIDVAGAREAKINIEIGVIFFVCNAGCATLYHTCYLLRSDESLISPAILLVLTHST